MQTLGEPHSLFFVCTILARVALFGYLNSDKYWYIELLTRKYF